jgi:hypothetical protein
MLIVHQTPTGYARSAAACRHEAARHAALKRKYEQAACHPWLAVEPDHSSP